MSDIYNSEQMILFTINLMRVYERVSHTANQQLTDFTERHHHIRDRGTHFQLQSNLIEHLWQIHSQ
jgi:hypothetical protein